MGVPLKYRNVSEQVIASYDFTEIAEGTGIVEYQGLTIGEGGSKTYILTTESIWSDNIETTGSASTTSFDIDFDLTPFNLPRTVRGIFISQVCVESAGSSSGNRDSYIVVKFMIVTGKIKRC